jgi:hypothetical protein
MWRFEVEITNNQYDNHPVGGITMPMSIAKRILAAQKAIDLKGTYAGVVNDGIFVLTISIAYEKEKTMYSARVICHKNRNTQEHRTPADYQKPREYPTINSAIREEFGKYSVDMDGGE